MVPWFKLFTEARNDKKLARLTAEQHRVWFHLLCFAAEQEERGAIREIPPELLAIEVCDGDQDLLRETCNELESLRVVTTRYRSLQGFSPPKTVVEIVFLNFEKRQTIYPSASRERVKERVAKHRDAKTLGKQAGKRAEACNEENEPVTNGNERVTACNDQIRLELRELNPLPLKGDPLLGHSPTRKPADMADVEAAERLLGSDPRTQHLGLELGRTHNLPEWIEVPGWRFLWAAQRLLSPELSEAKRGKWAYYLGIVRGLSEAEREEPSAAPKESKAQRIYREQQEGIEREKAKRASRRKEAGDGDG